MDRIDPLRIHRIDESVKVIVSGMIRKRENLIALVTILRTGIHSPATHHRETGRLFHLPDRTAASGTGRHNENMPERRTLFGREDFAGREPVPQFGNGLVHGCD